MDDVLYVANLGDSRVMIMLSSIYGMTTVADSSSKVDKLLVIFKIFRKGKMLFHG